VSSPLDTLKQEFAARRAERLSELRALLERAEQQDGGEGVRELRAAFHKLAGSAGIFGFPRSGEIAREGEQILERAVDENGSRLPGAIAAVVGRLVRSLDEEAGVLVPGLAEGPIALLIPGPGGRVDAFERELTAAGFATRIATCAEAPSLCPGASTILIDVDASGDGYALCRRLSEIPNASATRILYSDGPSAFDLVKAHESRADRLIHRASDLRTVLRGRRLTASDRIAGRILSVEDDSACGRAIEAVLKSAGHSVRMLSTPEGLLEQLSAFRPELLLLDCDLPKVHGFELARVVRCDARHESIPIVFVSSRAEQVDRRKAARAGGDDFVPKPFAPEELLEVVETHLRRNRALRRKLDADPLTDLLNRSASVSAVDDLIQTAAERRSGVLVAILDLDHFKRVNDEFGHPTGDRVLRELAAHLQESLRACDVAGRLGGEEMVVAMEGASRDELLIRLDELRSTVPIELPSGKVTFSAGCAWYPDDGAQAGVLLKRADGALYAAKTGGRNRVVAAWTLPETPA
jgi:diguanylate cyclase (GGDEF)-like protein